MTATPACPSDPLARHFARTVVLAIPLLVVGLASIRRRYRNVYQAITPAPAQPPLALQTSCHGLNHHCIVWIGAMLQPALDAPTGAPQIGRAEGSRRAVEGFHGKPFHLHIGSEH